MWERSPVLVTRARHVHGRNEYDTGERSSHAEELWCREALDSAERAENERPHTTCRCQDRNAGNARVLQAGRGEVVGEEPEHTELKAQNRGFVKSQLLFRLCAFCAAVPIRYQTLAGSLVLVLAQRLCPSRSQPVVRP